MALLQGTLQTLVGAYELRFFTVLGAWILYAGKSNDWALRATFTLAVCCLLFASFLAWLDMHRRALRAEKSLEAPPISSSDWEEIAEKMQQCCQFLSVVCAWTCDSDREWRIYGNGDHTQTCEAWLARAGKMLIESPKVKLDVPQAVKDEPNDFARWCRYLDHRGHLRRFAGDVLYDKTPRHLNNGTIEEVGRISALLAMEFVAKEFAPQV